MAHADKSNEVINKKIVIAIDSGDEEEGGVDKAWLSTADLRSKDKENRLSRKGQFVSFNYEF